MPITSKYLFVVSMDVDPAYEDLFNEVYDTEHVPWLSTVPGVISVTRAKVEPFTVHIGGKALDLPSGGEPRYTAIYEIASPDVLTSAEWAAQGEKGRWATEVRPHTSNRRHALRKVL